MGAFKQITFVPLPSDPLGNVKLLTELLISEAKIARTVAVFGKWECKEAAFLGGVFISCKVDLIAVLAFIPVYWEMLGEKSELEYPQKRPGVGGGVGDETHYRPVINNPTN